MPTDSTKLIKRFKTGLTLLTPPHTASPQLTNISQPRCNTRRGHPHLTTLEDWILFRRARISLRRSGVSPAGHTMAAGAGPVVFQIVLSSPKGSDGPAGLQLLPLHCSYSNRLSLVELGWFVWFFSVEASPWSFRLYLGCVFILFTIILPVHKLSNSRAWCGLIAHCINEAWSTEHR